MYGLSLLKIKSVSFQRLATGFPTRNEPSHTPSIREPEAAQSGTLAGIAANVPKGAKALGVNFWTFKRNMRGSRMAILRSGLSRS
jgi:hypothetical protein